MKYRIKIYPLSIAPQQKSINRSRYLGEIEWRKAVKEHEDKKKLDYLSYKYAASSAMLLKKWMHEGMEESAEFLAEIYLSSIQDLSSYKHGDNYK